MPAGSHDFDSGKLSGLGDAQQRLQLRHGDRWIQGRISRSRARSARDFDDDSARRDGRNGVLGESSSYGRSFAVYLVGQRPTGRPLDQQQRHDQRHADDGGKL